MNINDMAFDPATSVQYDAGYDKPSASQHQADTRRSFVDPEFKAYMDSDAWWIDKGFHADAAVSLSGRDAWVNVRHYFLTQKEATEFAAQFPKGVKVRVTALHSGDHLLGVIEARFNFISNGVTGGKNETAIKRWESFKKTVTKLGLTLNWTYPYSNSISFEQLEVHNS